MAIWHLWSNILYFLFFHWQMKRKPRQVFADGNDSPAKGLFTTMKVNAKVKLCVLFSLCKVHFMQAARESITLIWIQCKVHFIQATSGSVPLIRILCEVHFMQAAAKLAPFIRILCQAHFMQAAGGSAPYIRSKECKYIGSAIVHRVHQTINTMKILQDRTANRAKYLITG